MTDKAVIEFVRQRMEQMGVESFHFEAMQLVIPKDVPQLFNLYNELWYLVGLPQNIKIISDTAYYFYSTLAFSMFNPPEFTGSVAITSTTDNNILEFVRVIIQK